MYTQVLVSLIFCVHDFSEISEISIVSDAKLYVKLSIQVKVPKEN